jgi:hypothetical protein
MATYRTFIAWKAHGRFVKAGETSSMRTKKGFALFSKGQTQSFKKQVDEKECMSLEECKMLLTNPKESISKSNNSTVH